MDKIISEKVTKQLVKDYIKYKLETDRNWMIIALLRIFHHQTDDEKAWDTTRILNSVGFTGTDAEILSSFAKQVLNKLGGNINLMKVQPKQLGNRQLLSPKQLALLQKKMTKYWKQILNIANQNVIYKQAEEWATSNENRMYENKLITELPHADYQDKNINAIDFQIEKMPISSDEKNKLAKSFISGKGIIGKMPTGKYVLFTPNNMKVLKQKPTNKDLLLPMDWQKYAVILKDNIGRNDMKRNQLKETIRRIVKEMLVEKWEDDVDVKSTGKHADKTIEQLKKEIEALRGKPNNKEKMGELLFALRAKQGWKKGEGATGLPKTEGKVEKSKSAKKVLQLMDKYEDGESRYGEFVKKVAKEDKISVQQLEKELEPFI